MIVGSSSLIVKPEMAGPILDAEASAVPIPATECPQPEMVAEKAHRARSGDARIGFTRLGYFRPSLAAAAVLPPLKRGTPAARLSNGRLTHSHERCGPMGPALLAGVSRCAR